MSLETCKCGKEFLTESDPYALVPSGSGLVINCGCYFAAQLQKEREELKEDVMTLIEALEFYGQQQAWNGCEIHKEDAWTYSEPEINYYEDFGGKRARSCKDAINRMRELLK